MALIFPVIIGGMQCSEQAPVVAEREERPEALSLVFEFGFRVEL